MAGIPALTDWRKGKSAPAPRAIGIEIRWHPVGPVMVKSGEEGIAVDMLPLIGADGSGASMVLPGSAFKGALRAHSERILRTVCGAPAPAIDDTAFTKRAFLEQIGQRELALARWLFGAPGERKADPQTGEPGERNDEPDPGLAALWVDDVYLAKPFDRDAWERVAEAADLEKKNGSPGMVQLAKPLEEQTGIAFDPAVHVAVDRWTGGAADGQLYSVLEPHPAVADAWQPIRLTLRLDRLRDGDKFAALGLLLLTLRDVADGLVPIGFGGNRGLGAIDVDEVTYRGLDALGPDLALDPECRDDGSLKRLPEALVTRIRTEWQEHIKAIREEPAHVG